MAVHIWRNRRDEHEETGAGDSPRSDTQARTEAQTRTNAQTRTETRTEAPPRPVRRRTWPRRIWPRRGVAAAPPAEPVATAKPAAQAAPVSPVAPTATVTRPVVIRRGPRRWPRHSGHNPVSRMIQALAWAAVIILGLGMLLTLTNANPGNELVDSTLRMGRWLAGPFHDVFTNPDPDHALYMNWGLAAAVYYLLGRALSYLTRF